ncbi:MAG: E3 binding domain-containing protein, partial [Acetobacteraceae bacterium]|nr:E3 binding domain-containing protein [Acetobacteraceae bacterium]
MPTNILMPALSPTMTEGTLSRWLKKEGDEIRSGDVIAEIETDKATMEVEAVDEGVLGKILVSDGTQGVQVNAPIGVLVQPGESAPAAPASATPPAPPPAPAASTAPATAPPVAATAPPSAPAPQAPPVPAPSKGNGHDAHDGRVFASPLARRMAKQGGIDLAALTGSGPNGRIVKADIEKALRGQAKPAPAP